MMPTATLALPHLGTARAQVTVNSGDALAAKAVLALHKAGRFDPGALHPSRAFPGALALMRGTFERWIRTMQSLFERTSFSMAVGIGQGSAISDLFSQTDCDNTKPILEIVLGNQDGHPIGAGWMLQRRYEAIERAAPGLAATALAMINLASRHGLPLWTPQAALYGASFAYWGGCEDEREYLESMGEGDADPADLDILTRAEFDAAIPPTVSHPREALKIVELERFSRNRVRRDLARIAQLCLEIRAACRKDSKSVAFHAFTPERMHAIAQLHHFASVRWSKNDPTFRIYDDWANPAYENGEALEAYGWHEVPIEPAAIKAWFAGMERTFQIAALGQQLLALIAEREA
jgi:PRTRC genetic system protein F